MRFKVGDKVISKNEVTEFACGDHPAFLLCKSGQELMVKALYSKVDFPVYGKDSYAVQDINANYGEFYIDDSELK